MGKDIFTETVDQSHDRHYITVRSDGALIDAWSDGPHYDKDTSNAVCINEYGGYQFRLYPDGEENPPIFDMDGIPLYKWDGKSVIHRTDEEIDAEKTSLLPSDEQLRVSEIKQRLTELDSQAIRPLRAILTGTLTDEDKDILCEIEAQAVAFREELAMLGGGD